MTAWMRRCAAGLFFMLTAFGAAAGEPGTAEPEMASRWLHGFNNRVRLIAGRARAAAAGQDQPAIYAGVEIEMPAGWKTYWRNPGEAGGIPPSFDWSKSDNLRQARVLYPAPSSLIDKSGTTYGYHDRVLFPVALHGNADGKPIVLRLDVAYGVCKDICIPAEGSLELTIPSNVTASPEALTAALARVPVRNGSGNGPTLTEHSRIERGGKRYLRIEVTNAGDESLAAYVEAPDAAYVAPPVRVSPAGAPTAVFEIDLSDGPDLKTLNGRPLTLTLVGSTGQTETGLTLE